LTFPFPYETKHSIYQITPAFVREAYALLRQSIIHVEQDDIDFDEDESKNPEGGADAAGGEESQDVEMSGADLDTTDASFSESAPVTNVATAGSSAGVLTSSPRRGRTDLVAPAQPKRRMVITHDKFVQLQSLIILHLSQVEQATGKGVDKEELIDWYLEFKEDELQDVEALEHERELITKMLRKLVKVSARHSPRGGNTNNSSKDNYLIEVRGDVQESLPPPSLDESGAQSLETDDGNTRVYYMVHPSVDTEGSSSAV